MIPPPTPPGASSPLTPVRLPDGSGADRLLPPVERTHPAPADPTRFAPTPEMGGPLLVTPAGSTTVATDGMRAAIERIGVLIEVLERAVAATRRAELVPHAPPLFHLEHALRAGAETARDLREGLRASVAHYGAAENAALAGFDAASSIGGALLGGLAGAGLRVGGTLAAAELLAGGPLPLVAAIALTRLVRSRGGHVASGVGRLLETHPQLMSNPAFVRLVRGIADGMDEGVLTAAGVPPAVAVALGASGRTGVSTSAGLLRSVGSAAGLLRESPVDVQRVDRRRVEAPPSGAVERLARVPEGDQVRIEQYTAPGRPDRYVVYIGPTETFDPRPKGEPWDLASNVGGVGGEDVGAIRATELAMADSGITSDSEVQLVGFSQGGMVATRIAADGRWNAVGLQTFGSPSGNVALPDGIQGMAVRNAEDFVPALAGPQTDHHLLQLERTVYADPARMPTDQAAPGHQRVAYAATAQAIDAARSAEVRAQSGALDAFTADYASQPGATITASSYHATRRDGRG